MEMIETKAKFNPGHIRISRGVMREVTPGDAVVGLVRHLVGDWGEVDDQDWKQNNVALEHGLCLLSKYRTERGTKFEIITEADRSRTTLLLPSERILQPSDI